MQVKTQRLKAASKAALIHLSASALVASLAALLVLTVWYPYPYYLLSGGRNLFLILISVDVVCGPLLTLVLYNPKKPRRELFTDLSLVVAIQLAALVYGLNVVHAARPLFLVHEAARFSVVTMGDYGDADVDEALARLDAPLRPGWFKGPATVGIRIPSDPGERQEVLLGGRDFVQHPEFYIPYDAAYRDKALVLAKPLRAFIDHYPATAEAAAEVLKQHGVALEEALFLPVQHRQDWVAVLDKSANILGFLPGDGFEVRAMPVGFRSPEGQ